MEYERWEIETYNMREKGELIEKIERQRDKKVRQQRNGSNVRNGRNRRNGRNGKNGRNVRKRDEGDGRGKTDTMDLGDRKIRNGV